MSKFLIEARDVTYQRVGPVENYTNFEAILRYNAVGSWSLTIPGNSPDVNYLQPGGGIIARIDGQDEVAFSGPITKISRRWDEGDQGAGSVTVSGVTDDQLLFERVTYPRPDKGLDEQTDDRYILVSNAGTLMELLVSENCGPDALPHRQYPELDIANGSSFGGPAIVSTRFDVVGEKLQEIANTQRIGFRVRQNDENRLDFEMFMPRDKSELVFGRQYGNLQAYSYDIEAPTATRLVFACQGEGKDRYFADATYDSFLVERIDDRDSRIVYNADFGSIDRLDSPEAYRATITEFYYADAELTFTGTGVRVYGQNSGASAMNGFYQLDTGAGEAIQIPANAPPRTLYLELNNLPYGQHHLLLGSTHQGLVIDYIDVLDERVVGDWRRKSERFYDRRDIPVAWNAAHDELINPGETDSGGNPLPADPNIYIPMLDQATNEAWEENGPKASLSMSPIDTESIQYGRDYRIGDTVTVDIDGGTFTEVLREVRLSDGDDGPRISPTIGDSQASTTPTLYKTVRHLWSKVRRLEAQ